MAMGRSIESIMVETMVHRSSSGADDLPALQWAEVVRCIGCKGVFKSWERGTHSRLYTEGGSSFR